jgi:hypothetical protein
MNGILFNIRYAFINCSVLFVLEVLSYSKNKIKASCAIQIKKMEYNKHQFTISEQEAKKIMDAVVQKLSRMKLNTNADVTKVYLDEKKEKVVEVTLIPSEIKKNKSKNVRKK